MKRFLAISLTLLLTLSLLAGCGAKSNGSSNELADGMMGGTGGSASLESGTSNPGESITDAATLPQNQKLVRKIWLDAETEDLDALLSQVDQKIVELSGYVEEREVYNGSAYNASYRYRHASLTIRIPVEQLDSFISHVSEASNITSTNETTENITLSYVATQSRITALETEQTRLLELLAQAETMEDLLKIESRLTDVRTELEEVTSQLRLYDNMVDYGTLYLNLSEVREYTVTEEPETVWQRIGSGFMQSLKDLGKFFTELFVFVVVGLPYFVIIGVVVIAVILLIKFRKKKAKKPIETERNEG
ncbi:MAG: DUF4349 domain-containing protein [Oscillospiraceae bacterium]|nr:DUF4349 domain-containing protein [Oscillospiraceae bacterium]